MTYDQVVFLVTPALMVAGALVAAYLGAKLYPAVSIPENNKGGADRGLSNELTRRFAMEPEENGTVGLVGIGSVWDLDVSYSKPRYAAAALSNQNIISENLPSSKKG